MKRANVAEPPISKLDAARRQLVTALRLFFDDRDPLSVYTLAHAAREVLEALCRSRRFKTSMDELAHNNEKTPNELRHIASYGKNVFKHADRDPKQLLYNFYDGRNDGVLFVAISDLRKLTNNSTPIECQVFETWFFAMFPNTLRDGNDS